MVSYVQEEPYAEAQESSEVSASEVRCMKYRKPLAVLGVVGVLAAVVVAGTAFAQTPTPTPNQQAKANYQNFFLDRVASILGIDRSKLDSALGQAKNDTIDQAAKDGRITQDQANRLKSQPNNGFGFGFGFGRGAGGPRGRVGGFGGGAVVNAVAKALGMNSQDLVNQLRSGKTVEDVVKAQGKTDQDVKNAVISVEQPRLDQLVKNGRITQDQENQMLDRIRNADLSNFSLHGGFGMFSGSGAKKQAPSNNPSMRFRVPVPNGAA